MFDRETFVARRSPDWQELTHLLSRDGPLAGLPAPSISRAANLYRAVCGDLMRARQSDSAADIVAYLDALTARAHNALYASRSYALGQALGALGRGFPRAFRKHGRFMAVSALMFVVPLLVGWLGALHSPSFAASVLPLKTLEDLSQAYSEGFAGGRSEQTDAAMTGFYVDNNVGIAFRCFATGILFGVGSAYYTLYNGLFIGTVFGFVQRAGHGRNLFTFVCGHSPFELTAIVIAGGAGLCMGAALISTEGRTRLGSLRQRAPDLSLLALGAAAMLCIAALIEAFWSPSSLPESVKFAFSALAWLSVFGFLAFAGRANEPRSTP
ncbi:MAG TPA: stage II sporulation protein M [Polyangiaceae bacterium]|nr:stage II sporulation protein M [Polyangiaceae bacterium]